MIKENYYLKDIIWGSRFFVNAQFSVGLVSLLGKYLQSEVPLKKVFNYVHEIHKQKKVTLYVDVKKGIAEIFEIEKSLQNNEITLDDKKIIHFVIKNVVLSFTGTMVGEE